MNELLSKFKRENTTYLAGKRVEVPKLTFAKWKQLDEVLANFPGLILSVMTAEQGDMTAYIVEAVNIARDDIAEIIAILSGLDRKRIEEEASIAEIIEFLTLVVKRNDLAKVVKNVRSLLPKME